MKTDERTEQNYERFAEWLSTKGVSATSIAKYIHYLDVIADGFETTVESLTDTNANFTNTLHCFDKKIRGAAASLTTYKTALRRYRDFVMEGVDCSNDSVALLSDPIDKGKRWCQEFRVENGKGVSTLISCLNQINSDQKHKWVFRGQGYAPWGLETSLGRTAYKDEVFQRVGAKLKQHENDSLWEFYREASKELEFRDFKELNLLALMQHYGCKTRLLDFSLSPLVAIYMALDQNATDTGKAKCYAKVYGEITGGSQMFGVKDIPMSLWAVDLAALKANACRWKEFAQDSFRHGSEIIQRKSNFHKAGITVVFPEMCNRRVSAQDGLFLMPNNLDQNFEENLCAELGGVTRYYAQKDLPPIMELRQQLQPGIVKFVISPDLRNDLEKLLADANVSAKSVYPDLVGLGKHVGNMIHI